MKYLTCEVNRLNINVLTETEVTWNTVMERNPDVVVVATGARQNIPDMPGIEQPHVYTADSVLKRDADLWGRVVVIGGGHIGCDVALYIAQRGVMPPDVARFLVGFGALRHEQALEYSGQRRPVILIEKRKKIAPFYGRTSRFGIMQSLRNNTVTMMTQTRCIEIGDGEIVVEREGKLKSCLSAVREAAKLAREI